MENNDIDALIKQYRQITRDDGNEKYANTQFELGYIYDNAKRDYDQAEAYYLNITREDCPEVYANAQLNLGYYYYKKDNFEKAELYFSNIIREDSPKIYAEAQLQLGHLYDEIKPDYDKAEVCYSNITREDSPSIYAKSQFSLARLYDNIKHDYDKVEVCLSNVAREDNPYTYAKAQFNLGVIYEYKKNNLVKAIESYSNILESDYQEGYSKAQYQLANIYFFDKNDSNKARDYYNKIKYRSSKSYIYISARVTLELIANKSSLILNKSNLEKLLLERIEYICKSANDIKNRLLVSFNLNNSSNGDTKVKEPERRVAHYTKPAVLFNLLKGDNPSKFRLNIVDFMNDPSENQVLTNWLNITNNSDNEIKSFLASFSFNHNSLNQFRLYGNEDNILGSGVSIAFNQNFFGLDTKRSISNEIALTGSIRPIMSFDNEQIKLETEQTEIESDDTLHPLPLYRCLYFDPKTEYMSLAKRNKQSFYLEMCDEKKETAAIDDEWERYIDALNEEEKIKIIRKQLKEIKKLMEELLEDKELQKIPNLEQLLSLAVLPISCLIKHAAFEDECRMIYITHIGDENIVEPQDYQSANSLYVEYTNVENYIDNIYLGPQCKLPHKLWLQNHFKKKLQGKQIKLIKSEMPLR